MVSNVSKETINFPPNLTDIQKPKSFNKKKGSKRDRISAPRYNQPLAIEHNVDSTSITIDPVVENQQSIEESIQTNNSPTDSIDRNVDNQQVYKEPVPIQPDILQTVTESAGTQANTSTNDRSQTIEGNLRRSSRVSKLSAKALEMLSTQKDLQEASIFRKPANRS